MKRSSAEHRQIIRYGDTVRFLEGPFQGMEGRVYAVFHDRDTARVMPLIFGRVTPFEVPLNSLERVPLRSEHRAPPSWLASKLPELASVCRRCGVQRLELFGSASTNRFDPAASDIDFLVLFQHRGPEDSRVYYFELNESLEKLLGRPVDLVDETAVDNPFFLSSIEPNRTLVYAACCEGRSMHC